MKTALTMIVATWLILVVVMIGLALTGHVAGAWLALASAILVALALWTAGSAGSHRRPR